MSTTYTFEGTVNVIDNPQTFSSGFTKQLITVIEDADKYPQELPFEFVKEKIEMLHKVKRGDKVKVSYNLRGSEWKGRYFVSLSAWKIEVIDSANYDSGVPRQPPLEGLEEEVPDDDLETPF